MNGSGRDAPKAARTAALGAPSRSSYGATSGPVAPRNENFSLGNRATINAHRSATPRAAVRCGSITQNKWNRGANAPRHADFLEQFQEKACPHAWRAESGRYPNLRQSKRPERLFFNRFRVLRAG